MLIDFDQSVTPSDGSPARTLGDIATDVLSRGGSGPRLIQKFGTLAGTVDISTALADIIRNRVSTIYPEFSSAVNAILT